MFSTSNATWASFDCRETVRRPDYALRKVLCPKCGQGMGYLGYRIRIPSKRQAKAWRKLAHAIIGPSGSLARSKDRERAQLIERLEEEIARLETAPPGEDSCSKDSVVSEAIGEVAGMER